MIQVGDRVAVVVVQALRDRGQEVTGDFQGYGTVVAADLESGLGVVEMDREFAGEKALRRYSLDFLHVVSNEGSLNAA